jgi:hypothetical protein
MAASTITVKLSPGEYETLKAELTDQLESVTLSYKGATVGPAKQKWGQRMARLESLLKGI